jgi:hypothetical protein
MAQRESFLIRYFWNLYEGRARDELAKMISKLDHNNTRLKWLQSKVAQTPNADGYEWGVFRVKRDDCGKVIDVERCNEDYLDLDEAMKN